MLSESEIEKLMNEINSLKSEVKDLRTKLNGLDRKKEDLFREKRKIGSDIYSRIKNAKDNKIKRDSLTGVIKNTKLTKEEIDSRIIILEQEIKKLKEEKRKFLEKAGVDDPIKLKKSIKALEFKIETEGLSFEKEKELMKVLQRMKKQYDSVHSVNDINKQLDIKYKELRDLRHQLELTKKIVQVSAKESQKHHIELIESNKEIDDLRSKESELEKQISSIKKEMHAIIEILDSKNAKIEEIKKILHENNVKLKEDFEKQKQEMLKHKDEEVKEKLKSGKKLTTEDLLILQRTMKN
ncbi:MAG: hypothetical protein KatS3mg002_0709 [Candidatus Woesearchaeota archaeon]|nr:MAG: hypothetical protein KatS3mg002_0709 [Candidatus Woesearchaeota archaeon]